MGEFTDGRWPYLYDLPPRDHGILFCRVFLHRLAKLGRPSLSAIVLSNSGPLRSRSWPVANESRPRYRPTRVSVGCSTSIILSRLQPRPWKVCCSPSVGTGNDNGKQTCCDHSTRLFFPRFSQHSSQTDYSAPDPQAKTSHDDTQIVVIVDGGRRGKS